MDGYGRRATDLRVSVTDRCNLRCTYCMPADGLDWVPRDQVLTYEELARVARICVDQFGFSAIRITGGEPTVRADLVRFVEMLQPLDVDLALTTNGVRLSELAGPLAAAGLGRVNVSLDSLCPETFLALTRRDALDDVLGGIDAAIDAGLHPVKLNCVVIRGVNDGEVVDLAAFARTRGVALRFIEFMPLDADGKWTMDAVVPAREILERIHDVFPLDGLESEGDAPAPHVEPAARFAYADGLGEVAVIASVTAPFCADCDRVRITAEGRFRTCLFAHDETDLRALLRKGADDDELAETIERAVATKWAGHRIGHVDFVRPPRSMSQIGG